jgi:DNA polymerase-1
LNLIQAFQTEQDIHASMAAQLFALPINQIDKQQRRIAKMTVFGIIYGISSFGLAQRTDLSRSKAQELIDALFKQFPGIQNYIENTLTKGRETGLSKPFLGAGEPCLICSTRGPVPRLLNVRQ